MRLAMTVLGLAILLFVGVEAAALLGPRRLVLTASQSDPTVVTEIVRTYEGAEPMRVRAGLSAAVYPNEGENGLIVRCRKSGRLIEANPIYIVGGYSEWVHLSLDGCRLRRKSGWSPL